MLACSQELPQLLMSLSSPCPAERHQHIYTNSPLGPLCLLGQCGGGQRRVSSRAPGSLPRCGAGELPMWRSVGMRGGAARWVERAAGRQKASAEPLGLGGGCTFPQSWWGLHLSSELWSRGPPNPGNSRRGAAWGGLSSGLCGLVQWAPREPGGEFEGHLVASGWS